VLAQVAKSVLSAPLLVLPGGPAALVRGGRCRRLVCAIDEAGEAVPTTIDRARPGRSAVYADGGMVCTGHPLATAAGADVLRRGGNAADAVLAAAGVLAVVQPMMCGLGGDTFCVWYDGRTRGVEALCDSGAAPALAAAEVYHARGYGERMPLRGPLSVAVPGAVHAAFAVLRRWGSGRFGMEDLWAAAIAYARHGHRVAPRVAHHVALNRDVLAQHPASARIYLRRDGSPLRPGDRLVQADYARSLELVARGGPDVFYRGALAEAIDAHMRAHGGLLRGEDLAAHAAEVGPPLAVPYRGATVHMPGLPSQGLILLECLRIAEGWDLAGMAPADAAHLLVEAKKRAYADRLAYAGDPRFVEVPLAELLSEGFAARRRASIDPRRAAAEVGAGPLGPRSATWGPPGEEDTTYLCAADRDGNALSFITSLSSAFGCGEVVEGTGILLNNRAGRGFTLEEGHPNVLAPGKRTMHTLQCYLVTRGDGLWLVGGTPGGDGQAQWNLQVLTARIDHGLDPQSAVETPRWTSHPGTDPAGLPSPYRLDFEDGLPESVYEDLAARGHALRRVPYLSGSGDAQLIERLEDGCLVGASDARGDGCAMGVQ
jgi:gamma-glutamyltranspeptidase/glutathione hydrolase